MDEVELIEFWHGLDFTGSLRSDGVKQDTALHKGDTMKGYTMTLWEVRKAYEHFRAQEMPGKMLYYDALVDLIEDVGKEKLDEFRLTIKGELKKVQDTYT